MKNNIRHSTRNGVVLLAAFTMVATSTLQVSAASPEDSTTTTQEVAPSTTVGAPPTTLGGPSTTLGGPSTTLGGSSTTLAEAIEEQLPLGEVSESRKGIDLLTTSSFTGAAYPGFVYMGIVYLENIGGLPAGEKSPVSFTLSNVPDYV